MKISLRNISWGVALLLIGSTALPGLAKKKKVQPVQKQVVAEDSLSPNDRKRFDYFMTEAGVQQAAGRYTAAFDLMEHARHINPKAAEPYFFQADYYLMMKQDSLASIALQKTIALNPDNLTYAERLAQYYISSRQYDKAIDAYEALYQKKHTDTEVLQVLAQLYQQQKNYPKLLNTIKRLETEDGESEQLTLSKMRVYEMMDDKKAAYNELKTLSEQHPLDMVYKVMLGNWLMQHNRQKEAYKYYTDVLKEEPDNSYAQMSLYDYYNATHQETQAHDMLDKILLGKKTDTDTKMMMFRSYIQDNENKGGDSTKVIALFDRVLDTPKPSPEIAELRAAYMNLKKMPTDTVCAAFQKVLDIAPDNVSSRLQLIQMLWNKKDYNAVIAQSDAAHEYNPEEMVFYYFGGMAHYQKMDEDAALTEFRHGVAQINSKSNADLVSDLYAMMGDILYKKKDQAGAYAAYDSCLQWKDDNIMALNNYAYYMSEGGKNLHKAEAMSYKTIKAEPNNGTYLDTYAWILFMEERYAEAKTYIDQALKNRDSTADNSVVFEHAGDIYAMNGLTDAGVDYWKQAYTDGHQTAVLKWKIDNKQYISAEELERRNNPKKMPLKDMKKTIKKGRRK